MSKSKNKRDMPLSAKVTLDGVLTLEIGIDTLAYASRGSPYVWRLTDPEHTGEGPYPQEKYTITQARGFAQEVKQALLEQREDGSSLLSDVLDAASQKVIEDGSLYFRETSDKDLPWK